MNLVTLRRAFFAAHLLLVPVPFVTGALDILLGSTLFASELDPTRVSTLRIDSTLRFYGGFWFSTGFVLMGLLLDLARRDLPQRARQIEMFWAMIFLGGLARVVGFVTFGVPPWEFPAYAALEVIGAPLFVLWLRRAWPA